MALVYLSLFVIIPTIFTLWIWERIILSNQSRDTRRVWSLFLFLVLLFIMLKPSCLHTQPMSHATT